MMVEDVGITLLQMMENAGRALAELACTRFLGGDVLGTHVTVLAGRGGNGGGALVCARHLHNWGARVQVAISAPATRFRGVPEQQLRIADTLGVPISEVVPTNAGQLIIDGLIGYNLVGDPRGSAREFVQWASAQPAARLALDVPSGLDPTTGEPHEPTLEATATLALALPKTGLTQPDSGSVVGELYLADIGVPPELYARAPLHIDVGSLFSRGTLLRLSA